MIQNYSALKIALATGGTYAGMSDAAIVAACNAATVAASVDIPTQSVVNYLALNGFLPTIQGWARVPPSPPVAGLTAAQAAAAVVAAQTVGLMIGPPPMWPTLQMSDATTKAQIVGMISALVTAGLLPQSVGATILAMSAAVVSQASLWGWEGGIIENDLIAARAMP